MTDRKIREYAEEELQRERNLLITAKRLAYAGVPQIIYKTPGGELQVKPAYAIQ
jgi:hypothetical protein